MPSFRPPPTASQRFRGNVDASKLSEGEFRQMVFDRLDALSHDFDMVHVRIDGLMPGGDDPAHFRYHDAAMTREIAAEKLRLETYAKVRAGALIGFGLLLAFGLAGLVVTVLGGFK